jgi:hypothetical protein
LKNYSSLSFGLRAKISPYRSSHPLSPLAPGKQIYSISGGKKDAPQMTQAVVDPLDIKLKQTQTLTVKARDPKGITEIKAMKIPMFRKEILINIEFVQKIVLILIGVQLALSHWEQVLLNSMV